MKYLFVLICYCTAVHSFKFSFEASKESDLIFSDGDCDGITHFEFRNAKYFSKNDLLNKTLTKINNNVTFLNNITWKMNDSVTYIIYEAKPFLKNQTSNQNVSFVTKNRYIISNSFA